MQKKKRSILPILIIAIVLLSAILGYAGYYFYSFTQLEITDVKVDRLTNLSIKGFSFSGHLDINNPNSISVSIKKIEYGIVFEPTGQLLSAGIIEGGKLPSKQITSIPFYEDISWAPALSLAIKLLTEKGPLNIMISGNVFVTDKIKLPFVYKLDVRQQLEDYVNSQKQNVVEKAVDTITEKYGETAGAIAERIAGFFS